MTRRAVVTFAALALLAAASGTPSGTAATGSRHLLVQLRGPAACVEAAALATAGGRLVIPELGVWRLPGDPSLRAALASRRGIALVEPEHTSLRSLSTTQPPPPDPLSPEEWWRDAIRIDMLTPPGPGVPVAVVDSGLDVAHPEFAGRPNLELLNPQEPAPVGGEHGTAVASLVGAPANGQGIVGVYPAAILRSWDAALGDGTRLETVEIVNGILEASRRGRTVINLSLGGTERDPLIEQAVAHAVARGALVVAASGNDGQGGSPLGYPAVLPHVVTVAATNRSGQVAAFSSRSPYVDLAAPGTEMTVATTRGAGWQPSSGTSFAAPLVSGAAAWVWSERPELDRSQMFEILRRSAVDIGSTGRDRDSGFGLLDVQAALSEDAPQRDPLEPNEDIDLVDPGATDAVGIRPLTTRAHPTTRLAASLDAYEDPRDVYRIWIPRGRTLVVRAVARAGSDVDLSIWRQGTQTTVTRVPGDDRLALAANRGRTETLRYRPNGNGGHGYLVVTPRKGTVEAVYRLTIAVRA